jgi:hypothetical protein
MDVIFSGNFIYYLGNFRASLTSNKGIISYPDGLYKVLNGILVFDNFSGGSINLVTQKLGFGPFDYKISIINGNLKNFNIKNFDLVKDEENKNYLGLFNTFYENIFVVTTKGYLLSRELFNNIFLGYYTVFRDRFSKIDYDWYYSLDWVIYRTKLGIIMINWKNYSNKRNTLGLIFTKSF